MSKLYMSNYTNSSDDSFIENFDIMGQIDEKNERLKEKVDKADQEKSKTPTPVSAMYYFFVLSIFYMIITTILIYTSVASGSTGIAINLIFVLLLVLGLYFINMSTIKNLCGPDDDNYIIPYKKVATITFIPWVIVFGTIFFLLELFPGWVRPFSNTIGYLIINFLGVESEFKKYLKSANDVDKHNTESSDTTQGNKNLATAIEFLNKNTSMFINEFPSDGTGFDESFKQLQKSDALKSAASLEASNVSLKDFEIYLRKMIKIKHTIGKGIWYILAGTVVSSISYNILLDIECQKSREKLNRSIDNLYSEAISKTGSKWRLMAPEFKDSNGVFQKIQEDTQINNGSEPHENNLNLKKTANGNNYIFIQVDSISDSDSFEERFNKKDDVNNAAMPYISTSQGDKVNWGGTVSLTSHDMSKYSMSGLELEEGNYIAIPVNEANKISYKYTGDPDVPETYKTTVELKYLYYEVIE